MSRFGGTMVEASTNRFGSIEYNDAPVADPLKANTDLDAGLFQNASPEQEALVSASLTPDDLEELSYTNYTNTRHGTNLPPEAIMEDLRFAHGENATFKSANASNRKATKWLRTKTGLASVGEGFVNLIRSMPQMRSGVPTPAGLVPTIPDEKPVPQREWIEFKREEAKKLEAKIPQSLKDARKEAQAMAQDEATGFLNKGTLLIADNLGNMLASAVNPAFGATQMFANEKEGLFSALEEQGVDPVISENWSTLYGMASAPIEYIEMRGRLGALKKTAGKKVATEVGKRGLSALTNILQELSQSAIEDTLFNFAVDEHNSTYGTDIQKRKILNNKGEVIEGSLAMTTIMEALGLSVKGARAVRQKIPLTKGDATRVRKQHTKEEISEIVANDPRVQENPELAEPLQAAYEDETDSDTAVEYFNAEEARFAEEAAQTAAKVLGIGEEQEKSDVIAKAPEEGTRALTEEEAQDGELIAQAPAEEAMEPKSPTGVPRIIGVSRASEAKFREQLGEQAQDEADYESQQTSLNKAIESGMVDEAENLANELIGEPREVSATEVMSIMARKAQLANEIEQHEIAIDEAAESGDAQALRRATSDRQSVVDTAVRLTDALSKGMTKNARAMAAMGRSMDRKTFTLENVIAHAIKNKGETLSAESKAKYSKLVDELRAAEAEILRINKEYDAKLEAEAQARADEIISKTLKEKTTVAKRNKAKVKRDKGLATLKKLQWQVNDITGVPFKVAQAIKDIAVSHIMDGASTLDEVVARVKKDVPDARVTDKVIYDSLGGRIKKEAKQAESDAKAHVAELKKQAKLQGQIADAMNSIFDPKRTKKVSSKEVTELRAKLKELRQSTVKTQSDDSRIEAIFERIDAIDDMVDRAYRPLKKVKKKSKDLIEAEEMLKVANMELRAQDRLALMEEMLRGDVVESTTEKKSLTSKKLEGFRLRIKAIAEMQKDEKRAIAQKKAQQKKEEQEAEATAALLSEVESLHRAVKEKKTAPEQKDKALKLLRRRQDKIFALIDEINNGVKPSQKIVKVEVEDSSGYLGMINNLKTELTAQKKEKARLRAIERRETATDERIDALAEEVEQFIRHIQPKRKPKSEYRADELKELRTEKRRQDTVAALLESIRTRTVTPKMAKEIKEDRSGYNKTIKNLRSEIRKEAWYQDQMELRELATTLDEITELDRRLAERDFEGFITPRQERVIKNRELVMAKIHKLQKKREIQRRIDAEKPTTLWGKIDALYELGKGIKLSFDQGHIGRQGGYALSNPSGWKNLSPLELTLKSIGAFRNELSADEMAVWVDGHPKRADAEIHNVHFFQDDQALSDTEYAVGVTPLQEKITNIVPKKLLTKGLRASERAQKEGMNYLRMKLYDGFTSRFPDATDAELDAFGSYLNAVTGYGTWKWTNQLAKVDAVHKLLTSLRFTASRMQTATILLDPTKMKHPNLRRQMIEDAVWFHGLRIALLAGLGEGLPDEWVEWGKNPDHSTFGRLLIHMPNKKTLVVDMWAGIQRPWRVLRAIQRGDKNFVSALFEDAQKSAHVTASSIHNIVHGKKYPNQDISRGEAIARAVTPIPLESLVDNVFEKTPAGYVALGIGLELLGHGAYTVDTKSLKNKTDWEDRKKKD